jgi:hypothetical protein
MDDSTRSNQSNLPVVLSRLLARRSEQHPARRHEGRVARLRGPAVAGVVATVAGALLEELLRRALTSAGPPAQPTSTRITATPSQITYNKSEMYFSREMVVKETIRVRNL